MSVAEFVYTVILKPKLLKTMANAVIRQCIPERLTVDGAVIILNPNDTVVSGALTFGVYEKPETNFLRSVFRPGMTFLDVGANLGYYTALAIVHLGREGKIIALEPDTENFSFLQKTIRANNAENVVSINKAAADRPGKLTLYVSSGNRGDNRLYRNDLCDSSYEVEVSTVDALLEECGVSQVDLVKIDVQGFERHVFEGMKETVRRSTGLVMLMEFWPFGLQSAGTNPLAFLNELEATGLKLFELTDKGKLKKMTGKELFISRYQGRRYANIVAVRGDVLPASLVPHA
jgi:FkbM family methyltransferase